MILPIFFPLKNDFYTLFRVFISTFATEKINNNNKTNNTT